MRNLIIAVMLLCGCAGGHKVPVPQAPNGGQSTVVLDIDGTLTPRPSEFLEVRADAAKAVRLFSQKGYAIIYLSARLPDFKAETEQWLQREHFPKGTLYVADTPTDVQHPDKFKSRVLGILVQAHWNIAFAYGDSTTDFAAYETVLALPKEHVFALLREGDATCQEGRWEKCLHGWSGHLSYIEAQPAA